VVRVLPQRFKDSAAYAACPSSYSNDNHLETWVREAKLEKMKIASALSGLKSNDV
jgi:hypothetical protein